MELKREFHNSSLTKGQDPDQWIVTLESLRRRLKIDYQNDISDEDLVFHIVEHIPKKGYESLITSFHRQLASNVDPLTLLSVKSQLKSHSKLIQLTSGVNELSLFSKNSKASAQYVGNKALQVTSVSQKLHVLRVENWT